MNRKEIFKEHELEVFFNKLNDTHTLLGSEFKEKFNRSLPFNEEVFDRWDKAEKLNFGSNSSIYDSSFVFGSPKVGADVWIGPFTIIDGSGELSIGDNVTVSSGVHIYTHDNIKQTIMGKEFPIEKGHVTIGGNTYIGPNSVIAKDVHIGKRCIIATNSFVKNSFEDNSIIAGNPARKIGEVVIVDGELSFKYS
jgi:acetyltransferase-like isoleucine patch superfamily enzyme